MIDQDAVPPDQAWAEPGVIIKNIYEGQSHVIRTGSGKNIGTDISPVVDVMIAGKIVKGVPVRFLKRVVS